MNVRHFVTVLFLFVVLSAGAQKKQALLIAVGQYPPESRIRPIAAVADLKFLKPILEANGFSPAATTMLINEKATKKAIVSSLKNLAAKTGKGDIVFISFGCHGQQIRDQRTVEAGKDEDDGYDEALVPYDAKSRYNPTGYKGENHLRDDELFPLLQQIRKKAGKEGSLLILLDACHSGTGTRADDFPGSRGEPEPFPDPENPFDPASIPDADAKFFDQDTDSLSNMVVFSGSGPHQINKQVMAEQEELGSLSWAFYTAMKELPAGSDYGTLFRKIKALIQSRIPEQLPMVEGNTQQLVFSGRYSNAADRNIVRVGLKGSQAATDSFFTLNKGRLDQLQPGCKGRLFVSGTNTVVCTAVLKNTAPFTSIGVAGCLLKKETAYEFRPDEEPVPSLSAGIRLDPVHPLPPVTEKILRHTLSALPYVQLGREQADYTIYPVRNDSLYRLVLADRSNRQLWTANPQADSISAAEKNTLLEAIRNHMRVQYLRTLEDGGELLPGIDVRLQPATGEIPVTGLVLQPGDRYTLSIENKTDKRLFYTVLDIYPDNRMEVLYPYKGKEPADYSIAPAGKAERKLAVSKGSPAGVEFLKVIVSEEPMDLRMVIEDPGRRPGLRSFELLVGQLFHPGVNGNAVRADLSALTATEIGIQTLSFTIQPTQ